MFAIRKISASDLIQLRAEAFAQFAGLQTAWTDELQEAEGGQNFLNAVQNYPLLLVVAAGLSAAGAITLFVSHWLLEQPVPATSR